MRTTTLATIGGLAAALATMTSGCDGPTYDTSPPFTPEPPAVYVAKVKNILVGQAPTDAEVAAVVEDPDALPGLIDGWMAQPAYAQKMMVFFELAFQQTQISTADFVDIIPTGGLGNGKALPLLVQNTQESFARTVLALSATGKPLTAAFTTKQVMMTPALMQLYAFMDERRADNKGKITDRFALANPTVTLSLTAQAPIPIAESLDPTSPNYLRFYNPDLATNTYPDPTCNGLDPISIKVSANALFTMMYGEIPTHLTPGGVSCAVKGGSGKGRQLADEDFTTWKLVTIRPPNAGEAPTKFYDLPTLRAATELVIGTPHPGFFTTPAFFANWPTNQSNQMRVTLNQAMIVATGHAIDGTDATTPASTPGLDLVHAAPGSACYSCHQLLDPMRSVMSSTYSWFYYPQTDPALKAEPGLFAFQNVVAPMATIDDFAGLLATHPLVPAAWVQKLCYYVNSAPCDETDREFQRLVDVFAKDQAWSTVVREVMASPITTNAAATKTRATNGEVIAVARRDHLCAALNNRLGFVDICRLEAVHQVANPTTIAQIVSGMPSDGYGRGATAPVLPNQPTLFYRGGLENICTAVSAMVVDGAADPLQPGARKWTSDHPEVAIPEFVSLLLGFTAGDARTAPATAALQHHFATAMQGGATATDAMRSTFVVACLSPSFIGIGL